MATTYRITNTILENPTTVLVWAYFSNDRDESFRFPLDADLQTIIQTLENRAKEIDQQILDKEIAYQKLLNEMNPPLE